MKTWTGTILVYVAFIIFMAVCLGLLNHCVRTKAGLGVDLDLGVTRQELIDFLKLEEEERIERARGARYTCIIYEGKVYAFRGDRFRVRLDIHTPGISYEAMEHFGTIKNAEYNGGMLPEDFEIWKDGRWSKGGSRYGGMKRYCEFIEEEVEK